MPNSGRQKDPSKTGRWWEENACRYLRARGLKVLEKRYRCRLGELDLVCLDNGMLVIVEVRARAAGSWGSALESVDSRKRRKLILATRHLLMTRPDLSGYAIRFDIIAINNIDSPNPELSWIRNAFDGDVS